MSKVAIRLHAKLNQDGCQTYLSNITLLTRRYEMSIGQAVRIILGKRLFPFAGKIYRSIFVDLKRVAESYVPFIPQNACILDIGGGDGEPLNHLIKIRPDIKVTMIDLGPNLGSFLDNRYCEIVKIHPRTSIQDYIKMSEQTPSCVIISDVVHHIPKNERKVFLQDLHDLVNNKDVRLIIKDIEPGYFRSIMGYLADRYISGDKNVTLVSKSELIKLVNEVFMGWTVEETMLMKNDSPNYALIFSRKLETC